MKIEEMQAKANELKTKLDAIDKFWLDNKDIDLKEFTSEQKQTIDTLNKEAQALGDEIKEAKGIEAAKTQNDILRHMLKVPVDRPDFGNADPQRQQLQQMKSLGQ